MTDLTNALSTMIDDLEYAIGCDKANMEFRINETLAKLRAIKEAVPDGLAEAIRCMDNRFDCPALWEPDWERVQRASQLLHTIGGKDG